MQSGRKLKKLKLKKKKREKPSSFPRKSHKGCLHLEKTQHFERKKQIFTQQKIGNSFGLPTHKQIFGKQPKQ